MRTLVAVLVACVASAIPIEAAAICSRPEDIVSPPSGSLLPPSPVLYVFSVVHRHSQRPDAAMFKVTVDDQAVALEVTTLFDGPAYRVFEVHVPVTSGSFLLRYSADSPPAEYSVSHDVRRAPLLATAVEWKVSKWACSHTDIVEVVVDGRPAAFLATWQDGTSAVVPPFTWDFDPENSRVALGHVSCLGLTIPPQHMSGRARAHFSLFALHADGSKTPVTLQHVMPSAWLEDDVALAVTTAPAKPAGTRRSALSLLLLVTAALLFRIWRFRSAPR